MQVDEAFPIQPGWPFRDKLSQWGATIEETADADFPDGARVIAEVISPERTRVPSTAPIVRFEQSDTTLTGTPIPMSSLVPTQGALLR